MSRAAARALSVVAVLAACTNRTGADELTVSVSASRLSLTPTEFATVRFGAYNQSDRTITLRFANACHFTYEVRDSTGAVADATSELACGGPAHTVEIGPFGALTDSMVWPSTFSRPPAGRHALRGFLGDDRRRSAGPLTIILE